MSSDRATLRRLSRQAIGATDGKVPTQSALVSAAIAVGTLLALAVVYDVAVAVGGGLVVGVALAVAIATVELDRPIRAALGGGLLLPAMAAAAGGPLVITTQVGVIAGGFFTTAVFVGFGVMRFRLAAFGNGAVATALAWLARVTLVPGGVTAVAVVVSVDLARVVAAVTVVVPIEALIRPTPGGTAMVGFVAICWLAYGGLWLAFAVLPSSSLLSEARSAPFATWRSRVLSALGVVLGGGSIVVALGYALAIDGGPLAGLSPIVGPVVESSGVRLLLLRVLFAGVVIAGAVWAIKYVGGPAVGARPTWLPSAVLVTGVIAAGAFLGGGSLMQAASMAPSPVGGLVTSLVTLSGPTAAGLIIAFGGLLAIGAVLAVAPIVAALGVVPAQTAGARFVLFGLAGAAALGAVGEGWAVGAFVAVVAGLIAWDIADHGAGLRADVGPTPARQDGTMIHALGSMAVGGLTILGAWGLSIVLSGIGVVVPGTLLAVVAAVAALIILVILLKG